MHKASNTKFEIMRVVLLLLLGSTQLCASLTPKIGEQLKGATPKALAQVGAALVDGSTLQAETSPNRTWAEAKAFCTANSMTIAAIDGTEKAPILDGASNTTGFNSYYWTSGRDALRASQFKWDASSAADDDIDATVKFLSFREISTCVVLDARYTGKVFFHSVPCTSRFGTLCQTAAPGGGKLQNLTKNI